MLLPTKVGVVVVIVGVVVVIVGGGCVSGVA